MAQAIIALTVGLFGSLIGGISFLANPAHSDFDLWGRIGLGLALLLGGFFMYPRKDSPVSNRCKECHTKIRTGEFCNPCSKALNKVIEQDNSEPTGYETKVPC